MLHVPHAQREALVTLFRGDLVHSNTGTVTNFIHLSLPYYSIFNTFRIFTNFVYVFCLQGVGTNLAKHRSTSKIVQQRNMKSILVGG